MAPEKLQLTMNRGGEPSGGEASGFVETDSMRPTHRAKGLVPSAASRHALLSKMTTSPYPRKDALHTKGSFQAKVFIWRNICPLVQLARAGRLSLAEFMARDNWLFLISIGWILALLSTFSNIGRSHRTPTSLLHLGHRCRTFYRPAQLRPKRASRCLPNL